MATVYVGRARGAVGFSRLVALKRAHSHVKNDEKLAASMKLEARLASRLHHANVVSVLDVEEDDGDLVLILDYVEGCTLRTLSVRVEERGERRPREMIRVILDVAAGLHAAHQTTDETGRLLGLVHRDVSPSNILVGVDGVARIADFGIAKAIVEGTERTETGVLKGKSSYMAPEYVMFQRASAQSDLFSLGVVAWEALAGVRLFKGPNEIETLKRVMNAETRPLSAHAPELAMLDGIFERALAREPSDRYASALEMATDLERVARAHDLVASHAEVAMLVERVARAELAERRRLLRVHAGDDSTEDAETVVAPSLNQLRSSGRAIPSVPSSALPAAGPPPSQRQGDVVSPLIPGAAPMSVAPITVPPSSGRGAVRSSTSTGALLVSTSSPAAGSPPSTSVKQTYPPRDLSRAALAESKSRGREMLALAGAFVLLGLALSAMAIQLGTAPPEDESPVIVTTSTVTVPVTAPSPETSATASAAPSGSNAQPAIAGDAAASLLDGAATDASSAEGKGMHIRGAAPKTLAPGATTKKAPTAPSH